MGSKPKLPCPVCGEMIGQLEQHLRRKQDQAHREYRQQGKVPEQKVEQKKEREEPQQEVAQETQGSGPDEMFESHGGGSQKVVQKQEKQAQQGQKATKGTATQPATGIQEKIQMAKEGKEPWEHDCPGYPDKAEFLEKKDECPRCGKNLQWGALGV